MQDIRAEFRALGFKEKFNPIDESQNSSMLGSNMQKQIEAMVNKYPGKNRLGRNQMNMNSSLFTSSLLDYSKQGTKRKEGNEQEPTIKLSLPDGLPSASVTPRNIDKKFNMNVNYRQLNN